MVGNLGLVYPYFGVSGGFGGSVLTGYKDDSLRHVRVFELSWQPDPK